RVNIQDFCEEYYEDILPIIMDKVRRDKRKEVHARLDFREGSRERRTREGSHYSSARTLPCRTSSRDHSRGRSRPHRLDASNEDCPENRERFHGIRESYDNFHSSYRTGINHGYRYHRSRHMKRGRDSESSLSSVSKSDSSNGRHQKSKSKRHKPTDEDDLTMPWMCDEVDPFTPRIWAARVWFDELPPKSIDSYKDLKAAFLAYFMQQKKYVKDPIEIHNIKQKDEETIEDFMERFKVETGRMKGAPECMRISGFMHEVNNPELTKHLNEHVPKTMEEMMITTTAFIRGEAVAASKKKGHTTWRTKDLSKQKNLENRSDFRGHPREGRGPNREITFPPLATSSGAEGPLVIEAEIGGHMIHRMYVDGGSSMEVLYEHCFNRIWPEVKNQMVPATASLTGFSGETIWPLGQLRLLETIGDADHSTRAWMNFMIVRSLSPYNGIIGRPGIKEIQAVPSTAHGMLKFPADGGIATICSTILIPAKCAIVITSSEPLDMTGVSRSIADIGLIFGRDIHPFGKRKGAKPRNAPRPSKQRCKN
nr:reverse transcriptase domain-containing protein [Tanacetum cinerariifolium]